MKKIMVISSPPIILLGYEVCHKTNLLASHKLIFITRNIKSLLKIRQKLRLKFENNNLTTIFQRKNNFPISNKNSKLISILK